MKVFLSQKIPCINHFLHTNVKNFAQKQNLIRFNKEMNRYNLKDFTKGFMVREKIQSQIDEYKEAQPKMKLSQTLKKKNLKELKFTPVAYFPKNKRILVKQLRKRAVKSITDAEKVYENMLEKRLFE